MVVWFAHVRVGHRQLPIPKPPLNRVGVFCQSFLYIQLRNANSPKICIVYTATIKRA